METMNRREWALVIGLTLLAVFTICAVPRPQVQASVSEPVPLATVETPVVVAKPSAIPTGAAARATWHTATMPSPTQAPTDTATPSPAATIATPPTPTPYPFDTRPDLDRYIYIDQRSQHLYLFERGRLVRAIPCSTGKPQDDSYTPAWSGEVGPYVETFSSFGTHQDDAWFLFKSAGGILIHGLPYTFDEQGRKVYQERDALGERPSSHGCIRISPEDAVWLKEWNPLGVPLTISDPYLDEWR